ncbi:hypothetical protein [Streptomyces violaceus]|uniref:Uncharacterized protein n=1 Tax=Streptomyces violaceus TaxID=1936 RepID=A0ABY9UA96_STRVL|nr:hypothetical protein [Streptomyces janthinus]WND19829.1 hypothetical protein RI060_21820 [Streptomyces janthinus]GGS92748.1 hypothetical protein GCM10010270_76130 [Streptomyces janthinus]
MHRPRVLVEPPDSRGLRQVRVGGEVVGAAWSLPDLRKVLIRKGFPQDVDLKDPALISWRKVGSDIWPDNTRKRRTTAVFMAAGLTASAIFLIVIGSEDAFGALTFASQVSGFLLFLAGVAQLLAVGAVQDYWGKRTVRYSGLMVLVGVLIALLVHSMLVALWFQEKEFTPWAFNYMPLAVWSLWATWIVVREKAWRDTPHPRQVTAGVLATALIAGANFAYSAAYQPYAMPPQITLVAKFGKPQLDPKEQVIHVPVTFSMQNTGKVPVTILGSMFQVHGRTSNPESGEKGLVGAREDADWGADSELYASLPKWRLITTGLITDPGDWFDPGTGQVEEVVVQVPQGADYESLEVDGDVTVLRKDRGRVSDTFLNPSYSWVKGETDIIECPPKDCGDYVLHVGELTHNNNIINVTRRKRYVFAIRNLGDESVMYAFIAPLNARGKVSVNYEPQETYGVATVPTGTVVMPFATLLKAVA